MSDCSECDSKVMANESKSPNHNQETRTVKEGPKESQSTQTSITDENYTMSLLEELIRSLNKTSDLLHLEREFSRKLLLENTELKIKIKELEVNLLPVTPLESKSVIIRAIEKEQDISTEPAATLLLDEKEQPAKTKLIRRASKPMRNRSVRSYKMRSSPSLRHLRKYSQKQLEETDEEEDDRMKVSIIGGTQLKYLREEKLSNKQYDFIIAPYHGARISELQHKYIDPNSDIVIVHAGTNDIQSSTPEQLAEDIVTNLKKIKSKCSMQTKVAFSSIVRRTDDDELNAKVAITNRMLEGKLLLHGVGMINNNNILSSNICTDGLHLKVGGIRKFARNICEYVKYC